MNRLQGKWVVITGASSGIGMACARQLATMGCHLVLLARRLERIEALASELSATYHIRCIAKPLDVRDRQAVQSVSAEILADVPQVDVLINNAGLAAGLETVAEADLDDWEQMIDTNLKGLLYMSQALLRPMLARGKGDIVNISSIAAHIAYARGSVYCATKAAVQAFTRALKFECLQTQVRVIDIAPGLAETEFSLVRFKGDTEKAKKPYADIEALSADDIAETVVFALNRPLHVQVSELVVVANQQALQLV